MPASPPAPLNGPALDQLFRSARTFPKFQDRPVDEQTLHRLHDLLKMGPTAQNCQPARFLFVTSKAAKDKLIACVADGNKAKVASAPVTAIIAADLRFFEKLPHLWHDVHAGEPFERNADLARETALRNATLQGAYLIMAARALGLDCGPMSGFDTHAVSEAFLKETPNWCPDFLCNIGYGDETSLFPRGPRPAFDDICRLS